MRRWNQFSRLAGRAITIATWAPADLSRESPTYPGRMTCRATRAHFSRLVVILDNGHLSCPSCPHSGRIIFTSEWIMGLYYKVSAETAYFLRKGILCLFTFNKKSDGLSTCRIPHFTDCFLFFLDFPVNNGLPYLLSLSETQEGIITVKAPVLTWSRSLIHMNSFKRL